MTRFNKFIGAAVVGLLLLVSTPGRCDFFGADLPLLGQILTTTLKELTQLQLILGAGQDTLGLLRDINQGLKNGLSAVQIVNPGLNPGVFGNVANINQAMDLVTQIYGEVPKTADSEMLSDHDKSVAESITMNTKLAQYADEVDLERDRILAHSQLVNPQGAAKLQNQSLAILIGVTTELLRTNSEMLKLLAENTALQNRREKAQSEHFQTQYEDLSKALDGLPENSRLPTP